VVENRELQQEDGPFVQLRKGDRIEPILPPHGARARGTVYYVDQLQILVKWDDGRSASLRSDFGNRFRIVEDEGL
jgi:hypothetical protein